MPSSASKMRRRTVARTCISKRQEHRLCRVAPSRTVLSVLSSLFATFVVLHPVPDPYCLELGTQSSAPGPALGNSGMSVESTKIIIPPNMKHVMADAQKDLGGNNLECRESRATKAECRRGRCKREEISVTLVNAKRSVGMSVGGSPPGPARRRASPRRRLQNKARLFWPRPAHKRTRPQVTSLDHQHHRVRMSYTLHGRRWARRGG